MEMPDALPKGFQSELEINSEGPKSLEWEGKGHAEWTPEGQGV